MNSNRKKIPVRMGLIRKARNLYSLPNSPTVEMVGLGFALERFIASAKEYALAEAYHWTVVLKQEKQVLKILEEDLITGIENL